jgi:hypothetical protein
MKTRHHPFGLNHPTWPEAGCWHYDTAEDAHRARIKVYGPNSGHQVVRRMRLQGPMGVTWTAFRVIAPMEVEG